MILQGKPFRAYLGVTGNRLLNNRATQITSAGGTEFAKLVLSWSPLSPAGPTRDSLVQPDTLPEWLKVRSVNPVDGHQEACAAG